MPRKRSEIWNHFTPEENKRARCGYCLKVLSLLGGSTGNLMRHLRLRHSSLQLHNGSNGDQDQSQGEGPSLSPSHQVTIEMSEGEVVECITSEHKTPIISSVPSMPKHKYPDVVTSRARESGQPHYGVPSSVYEDLLKLACSNIKQNKNSEDNYDHIGRNVATKLRAMETTQKAIAERLIGEILFQGQMNMLAVNTSINTPSSEELTAGTPLRSFVINTSASLQQQRRELIDHPKTTYIITPQKSPES